MGEDSNSEQLIEDMRQGMRVLKAHTNVMKLALESIRERLTQGTDWNPEDEILRLAEDALYAISEEAIK